MGYMDEISLRLGISREQAVDFCLLVRKYVGDKGVADNSIVAYVAQYYKRGNITPQFIAEMIMKSSFKPKFPQPKTQSKQVAHNRRTISSISKGKKPKRKARRHGAKRPFSRIISTPMGGQPGYGGRNRRG